jgi:hypothetical protein
MVDSSMSDAAKDLDLLAIINPDQTARARIRQVLRSRIKRDTRVLTFDKFEEFARFLR